MDAMLKECTKPHSLLHLVSGAGLGMIVLALLPGLSANALTLGVVLVVVALVAEYLGGNPAKK